MGDRTQHPVKKILRNRNITYAAAAEMVGYSRDRFESLLNGRGRMNNRAKAAFDALMVRLIEDDSTRPGKE